MALNVILKISVIENKVVTYYNSERQLTSK
jgi:hypothetical protein